jgi:hypothetical protein
MLNPRKVERYVGVVALIFGLTGTFYSGYIQVHDEHQLSQKVSCQAAINKEFLAVLKTRSGISNENTANINNFVLDLIGSKNNTPAEDAKDINAYLTELAKINGELKSATYPSIGNC